MDLTTVYRISPKFERLKLAYTKVNSLKRLGLTTLILKKFKQAQHLSVVSTIMLLGSRACNKPSKKKCKCERNKGVKKHIT